MKLSWLFLLSFLLHPLPIAAEEAHYDILLKNGLVVDGTGLPPYQADVALEGGKIAKIGHLDPSQADYEVDASGLVVAPGFIDLLRHNDLLWTLTAQERAIREGITTGLTGNCGFSVLDVDKNLAKLQKYPGLLNVGTLIGQGTLRDWFVKTNKQKPATPRKWPS